MADLTPTEKLQPCLLDRLTDDEPDKQTESKMQRVMSLQKYRDGVKRDLAWLFNTTAYPCVDEVRDFVKEKNLPMDLKEFPEAYRSVINFGVRQLCGQTATNAEQMQEEIAAVVQIFEPRISPRSLIVQAEKDLNKVEVVIEGDLWTRERPESLRLNAEMDVENGQCVFGDSPYGSPTSSTL